MIIRGNITGVWLNENNEKMPARLKLMGQYFSTFEKELLISFEAEDFVEIEYHIEKEKYNTIDTIKKVKSNRDEEINETLDYEQNPVSKAKEKVNKILDNLEEE